MTQLCNGTCCVEAIYQETRLPADGELTCPSGAVCGPLSPKITSTTCDPSDCEACEGDDVTLSVSADGLPTLMYEWRKGALDWE